MTRLIKLSEWDGGTACNVVFVHGLGGHAYATWQRGGREDTFWPIWLSRDVPGIVSWAIDYEAPLTNWFSTGMELQDRAKNVLECLLGERGLRESPLVFVCHSLGGLVLKQVLRTAVDRLAYSPADATFLDAVYGVVFIGTPHTGSVHATWLDRLRLLAWPSKSTLDLVKNNANLRYLNVWYRNWSGAIHHKVFYEKRGTAIGSIVADDSSDPGLLHVDPIGIDGDHQEICRPTDLKHLVYARTRDFILDEIFQGTLSGRTYGRFKALELPKVRRARSQQFLAIVARLIFLIGLGGLIVVALAPISWWPSPSPEVARINKVLTELKPDWTNIEYVESVLGKPQYREEDLARFDLGGYTVSVHFEQVASDQVPKGAITSLLVRPTSESKVKLEPLKFDSRPAAIDCSFSQGCRAKLNTSLTLDETTFGDFVLDRENCYPTLMNLSKTIEWLPVIVCKPAGVRLFLMGANLDARADDRIRAMITLHMVYMGEENYVGSADDLASLEKRFSTDSSRSVELSKQIMGELAPEKISHLGIFNWTARAHREDF